MREVKSCTVIYKSRENGLYNLTLTTKDNVNVCLYSCHEYEETFYKYDCFQDLYRNVIAFLARNGFMVSKHRCFNSSVYHINWIDLRNPTDIQRFGLSENF